MTTAITKEKKPGIQLSNAELRVRLTVDSYLIIT